MENQTQFNTIPKLTETNDIRKIDLNQKETQIFNFLKDVVNHHKKNTTLRVAGGWVRDKVLGQNSDDIDVTLDNMMGKEFAESINEYLKQNGQERINVGIIQSNPEQSKHLETATMKLFETFIDFVNLRTEEYADSRIPITKIGTPEEDALRRDLTINSLFYNINEGKLEDFTGKGISDLAQGLIRTPLHPLTTFLDDPLRILRAIRFASRLNFQLDPELCAAVFNNSVKEALDHKISRERIGKELNGMFPSGDSIEFDGTSTTKRSPLYAYKMILELDLYDCVFKLPPDVKVTETRFRERSLEKMAQMKRSLSLPFANFITNEEKKYLLMAAFLTPLLRYSFKNKKNKAEPVIKYVILESLKWSSKDADTIYLLAVEGAAFHSLIHHYIQQEDGTADFNVTHLQSLKRVDTGLLIRKTGPLWRHAVLLALSFDLPHFRTNILSEPIPADAEPIIRFYEAFFSRISEMNLDHVYDMKPLLNGNEVLQLIGKPPGPWLGALMEQQVRWQLDNPNGTIEECSTHLSQLESAPSSSETKHRDKKTCKTEK